MKKRIKLFLFFINIFLCNNIQTLISMPSMPMPPSAQLIPPTASMPIPPAIQTPSATIMPIPPSPIPIIPTVTTPPAAPIPTAQTPTPQTKKEPVVHPASMVMGLPDENLSAEKKDSISEKPEKQEQIISKEKKEESAEEKAEEKKDIYLNFENTELANFINYMAELKKINLIPNQATAGAKISLTIRDPLTIDGAWNVFLTVLEMAGFTIVKLVDVYKIIPKNQKTTQPLPAFINVPYDTLPDSDENLRYVVFLQNIQINSVINLIKSMLSPEHSLIPYPEVNGMIITDKSYNIKSAMQVVQELDQTGLQESVVVMQLKRTNASDIKNLMESLKSKTNNDPLARLLGRQTEGSLEYFSSSTRIIAEDRTNSLILLGNKKSIKKIEDFIVNHLDTELKGTESPLHIYELQNTDAEQIKDILETVTDASSIQQAGKYGAVRGGVKYFKSMKFQVDKDGNRLICSTTDKQDWELLKKTIEDLDKPQPQVALETLIVTVNLEDKKELGGALRNKESGQIGKGVNFQSPTYNGVVTKNEAGIQSLLGNMLNGVTGGLGSTVLSFGKGANVWGFFKALKNQSNASILSQPFFTAANKTRAHIDIGSINNVVGESTQGGFEAKKEVKASTIMDITPQINIDGLVRLTIDLNFSEFTDPKVGNINAKILKTDVTVADGQVLVLGGFIKTKVTETENKVPVLGSIPVLGWLFKNKNRSISKDYIFVFISPTIVKPRTTPGTNLYTRMKLHDARENILDTVEVTKTNDPIHNWFFNPDGEDYSHKVTDFANARYQPTTVDVKNDPYYRATLEQEQQQASREKTMAEEEEEKAAELLLEDNELKQQREKLKQLIIKKPIINQEKTMAAKNMEAPTQEQVQTINNFEKKPQNSLKELLLEKPPKPTVALNQTNKIKLFNENKGNRKKLASRMKNRKNRRLA